MTTLLEIPQQSADSIDFKPRPAPYSAMEQLGSRLGVEAAAILDLVGIPERTRSRRRHDGFLKPDEADRLARIVRVFEEAVRVFGSEAKAAAWLKTPSAFFESTPPLSYLGSDGGAHAVGEELVRIEFGDFA